MSIITNDKHTWTSARTGCIYTFKFYGIEDGKSCVAGVSKLATDGSRSSYQTSVTWRGEAMRGLPWPREDEDELVLVIHELWTAHRDGRDPDIDSALAAPDADPDAAQRLAYELTTIDRRISDCEACLRHPYPGSEREVENRLSDWRTARTVVEAKLSRAVST